MSPTQLLILLFILTAAGYILGRKRAFSLGAGQGGTRVLHSRPTYYGALTALWCAVPALIVFSFWLAFESSVITDMVVAGLPYGVRNLPLDQLNLVVNDIRNLVNGNIVGAEISPVIQGAAGHYESLKATSHAALSVLITVMAIAGILGIQKKICSWPLDILLKSALPTRFF